MAWGFLGVLPPALHGTSDFATSQTAPSLFFMVANKQAEGVTIKPSL